MIKRSNRYRFLGPPISHPAHFFSMAGAVRKPGDEVRFRAAKRGQRLRISIAVVSQNFSWEPNPVRDLAACGRDRLA